MQLSERVLSLAESQTLAITKKIYELRSEGKDVISFGAGEPDFNTPLYIKEAGIGAIKNNFTKYTPSSGIIELKEAICEKLKTDNGLDYKPEQIVVSSGAKQCLINALLAFCGQGDEVLIPTPCWVSYPEQVRIAGAEPVFVNTECNGGFYLNAKSLRKKISSKTRVIMLNSPNNPTGSVMKTDELKEIAEIACEHDLFVISDEIYEKLVYGGAKHLSIASLNKNIQNLTVVVNGFSKAYSMTGWRIGYSASSREVAQAMDKIQGHCTTNASSISQLAALEALSGPQKCVEEMKEAFALRRDNIVTLLNSIPGVQCPFPDGSFYVFPNVKALFGKKYGKYMINSSFDLVDYLIDTTNVATVPGSAFQADDYIRLSYATSMEKIKEGLGRIAEAVQKLV